METQNISAQLYNKQLPADPDAARYGCENTSNLSTCVESVSSDNQIENAYQKQLDLSEYYKSPNVFNAMKEEYMSKTMENENEPNLNTNEKALRSRMLKLPAPEESTVGPTDFLNNFIKESFSKSNFGSTTSINLMIIFIILAIVLYFFYIKEKI